ncbi:ATP-binding cassette domain-containing protein [Parvimonas sp. G1425]|uniref:ATP-binding cassette domain-containing protein n=1 Tax=Parvimonas sp. G1425 TaxID=3387694 RepID=UPI0039E56946
MISVVIITALTYMFGMIYTREFFKGIVIFKNENFNNFFKNIVFSFLPYVTFLFIIAIKKIYFDRYYIQYILIPNFEKILKTKIQKKCSEIEIIDYEKNNINEKIHEATVCSTNIFRLVETVISYFGLILNIVLISNFIIFINIKYLFFLILILFPLILENYFKVRYISKYRLDLNLYERREKEIENCVLEDSTYPEFKIYNTLDFVLRKLDKAFNEHNKKFSILNKKIYIIELISKLLIYLGKISIYLLATFDYINTNDIGNLIIVIVGVNIISKFIEEIFSLQGYIMMFSKLSVPYFEFMSLEFEKEILHNDNSVELSNLKFKYPNAKNYCLKNINLKINRGEIIAIVGKNGSGKSTLAKILLGLYKPSESESNKLIAKNSVVFQDFCKYPLDVRNNIELGSESSADSFAIMKSMGFKSEYYEKLLGKEMGGLELSGGQWQKLAICRGIYKDSNFLVLDEPTAEIDPIFEKDIYDILKKILSDKTGVIITHRLGSIKFSDKILILDDGEILAYDTHNNLLKNCDYYKKMWDAQKQNYL